MLRAEMSSTMELLPLLCLCVLSCSGSTSAAGAEPERINVKEGSDVTLPCSIPVDHKRPTYKRFVWKKDGQKEVYVYDGGLVSGKDEQFKDRISFPGELEKGNASITIRNAKVADTGNYTCESGPDHKQEVQIYLRVEGPLKDRSGENIRGTVYKLSFRRLDGTTSGARLWCEVNGDTFKPEVQLNDSNGIKIPAEEPQVSETGGHYNITLQTTVTKSGTYYCVATQKEISHQIADNTYVSVPGAAPKPSVTTLGETQDGVQLQCEVLGASPKPVVLWQDSAGNTIPAKEPQVSDRGGSYDIILQATVTKTDNYRCVATQEEIKHQIFTETYVPVHGLTGFSTVQVVFAVIVAVVMTLALVGVALLIRKYCIKPQSNSGQSNTNHLL